MPTELCCLTPCQCQRRTLHVLVRLGVATWHPANASHSSKPCLSPTELPRSSTVHSNRPRHCLPCLLASFPRPCTKGQCATPSAKSCPETIATQVCIPQSCAKQSRSLPKFRQRCLDMPSCTCQHLLDMLAVLGAAPILANSPMSKS